MPAQDQGIDLIAYDTAGRVTLMAEVKSSLGTSPEWAAQFRRNLLAHGMLPDSKFFLIATPDRMYFWKQSPASASDEAPACTIDAGRELKHYFDKLNLIVQGVGNQSLQVLVAAWLSDIAGSGAARAKEDPALRWLNDSGLLHSLEDARIETYPA